jgi:hypothetical protein
VQISSRAAFTASSENFRKKVRKAIDFTFPVFYIAHVSYGAPEQSGASTARGPGKTGRLKGNTKRLSQTIEIRRALSLNPRVTSVQ